MTAPDRALDLTDSRSMPADDLFAFLYHELRAVARRQLHRERRDHTLSSVALVHEVYLRIEKIEMCWRDETHFVAIAARVMRHILVDYARSSACGKRGGGDHHLPLTEALCEGDNGFHLDILQLDAALKDLSVLGERISQVVELRFFSGLSVEQTAAVLGISSKTVKRDWAVARTWLRHRLEPAIRLN